MTENAKINLSTTEYWEPWATKTITHNLRFGPIKRNEIKPAHTLLDKTLLSAENQHQAPRREQTATMAVRRQATVQVD
jgi:hypothetical protein